MFLGEANGLWDLDWSRSGKLLATSDGRGIVSLYEAESGRRLTKFILVSTAKNIQWSPDERQIVAPNGTLSIIDVNTGEIRNSEIRSNFAKAVWSPNGNELVSIEESGMVRFWDSRTMQVLAEQLDVMLAQSNSLDWSPDGKWVVAGGMNGRVSIWDATLRSKAREVVVGDGHSFGCLAWEPLPIPGVQKHPDWPRLFVGWGEVWDSTVSRKLCSMTLNVANHDAVWTNDGSQIVWSTTDGPKSAQRANGSVGCGIETYCTHKSAKHISCVQRWQDTQGN